MPKINKIYNKIDAVDMYRRGMKIVEISRIFHCRASTVSVILKDFNVKIRTAKNCENRPYKINHDYFSSIDSHDKAYALGLMYSDGCVMMNNNTVNLVSKDIDMLFWFKNQIGSTKKLIPNSASPHCLNVTVSSSKMKNDLIALGCLPRKSLILQFPNLQQVTREFLWSFICGYFDGDGCISGKYHKQVKFISSTGFCIALKEFLTSENILVGSLEREKRYKPETAVIRVTNKPGILIIKEKMYKNISFCLARKHERFP